MGRTTVSAGRTRKEGVYWLCPYDSMDIVAPARAEQLGGGRRDCSRMVRGLPSGGEGRGQEQLEKQRWAG